MTEALKKGEFAIFKCSLRSESRDNLQDGNWAFRLWIVIEQELSTSAGWISHGHRLICSCVCVSVCVFILFLWEERDKKTDANVIKERKSPTFMVPWQSSNYAQTRTQNRLVI